MQHFRFCRIIRRAGTFTICPRGSSLCFDFQQNQHDLNLTWQIKDGYYLYRKQIRITPEHAKIADVQLPQGVCMKMSFTAKARFTGDRLTLPVTINQASAGATLTVTYQGCADAGFCYPPETKTVPLSEVVANNAAPQPVSVPQQEQPTAQLPFSAALGVVDRYWYRLYAMRAANVPTDFWHRAGW
ncbi:thiol:disulfide interchange protein [Escherichia coli]|nr:thiol:disulfide interchange protein [Escherichia coli]